MKITVFDIGGTLMEYKDMPLSWLGLYKDAFRFAAHRLGLKIAEADIERSYEVMKSYNPRLNPREKDISPEIIFGEATAHWQGEFRLGDVISGFFESMKLTAFIYPETIGILERLKAEGFVIAALTDVAVGMPDELHMSYFPQLMPYFDMYVSSVSCGYRKPSPKGLADIAEKFGAGASDMVMIGDEPKDIACAKRFGCRAVLIDRQGNAPSLGQDFTVGDLNGIWEALR